MIHCVHCNRMRVHKAPCCKVKDLEPPPIESEWTPTYQAAVDSDLIRAAWRTPISTTRAQRSLEDLPLFASGKEDQQDLF